PVKRVVVLTDRASLRQADLTDYSGPSSPSSARVVRRFGFGAVASALFLSACGSTSIADVDADCKTSPSPATIGPVSVTCSLKTHDGEPIQGQTLNLEAS